MLGGTERTNAAKIRASIRPWLATGYALLWALGLPFLCWGNWATPGHPHAAPHLVFFPPAAIAPAQDHAHHHSAEHDAAWTQAAGSAPAADVSGVARPPTLLVAILVFVLFRRPLLLRPRLDHWPQLAGLLQPHAYAIPIPTPPPRPLLA